MVLRVPLRREAEVFLTKTLRELDLGTYVEPSNMLLRDDVLQEWLPASTARVRPSTLLAHRQSLSTPLLPTLGAVERTEGVKVCLPAVKKALRRQRIVQCCADSEGAGRASAGAG